ncbi:MAG: hypothetical protein ACLUOF_04600 [Ruminococcus sp.]
MPRIGSQICLRCRTLTSGLQQERHDGTGCFPVYQLDGTALRGLHLEQLDVTALSALKLLDCGDNALSGLALRMKRWKNSTVTATS